MPRRYSVPALPMTRPQRTNLAWTMFAIGLALLLWMIWNQRLYAWSGTATGGTVTREFGLVRYLTITTQLSGPFGGPSGQKVISSDWQWRIWSVATNLVISAAVAAILAFSCRRSIRKDRLVGRCDECGYDLTGLHSEQCPECGARVDASSGAGR